MSQVTHEFKKCLLFVLLGEQCLWKAALTYFGLLWVFCVEFTLQAVAYFGLGIRVMPPNGKTEPQNVK